ncbi:hypothetical protein [Fimbriiglobus ruber]|uniref:MoxR-vWA-beta-propeller ternary system domain-containing protein n=1 Tax=Fimbriiglobus ruber TaxID=1908690 RepID=A0A225DYE2_9BACT|nr:hypothetical protein [Fimbriiglobus ruber]OWK46342.1 hypothetical protein FRUB_00041 [Fimbriiglobus ruber]
MRVTYRLTRRSSPAPADAYLLFAADAGPLAAAVAGWGQTVAPTVYPVNAGYVVVPRDSAARPMPGAVRLRRLAGDLFVPADADLSPALLPDEMVGLTRDQGLIFLPGGDVLAFDPHRPLRAAEWVASATVRRATWLPFPPRPDRAEHLSAIERPSPPASLDAILGGDGPSGAEPLAGAGEGSATGTQSVPDGARPPAGTIAAGLGAAAVLGLGQFLAWLGRQVRVPGLARAGGDLARKALARVPRLTEKVLGAQEAALREVLRQLQSGNIEKALRHAPIAVPDPDRQADDRIGTDASLGTRDPRYHLRDLIASGAGVGTTWLGGGDVWAALAQEYRRLAEEATRRGDFRRAAFLYGVLLRDIRSAANVLMSGGFYHDAALLFRDKLRDAPAAAAAFEKAGDYDEALRIYDRLQRYEAAAELLRRIGDHDRAADYFSRAAEQFATNGHWLAAGDLARDKLGRRDLATSYYRAGWKSRPTEAIACAERLVDELLAAKSWSEVDKLFDEAQEVLVAPRSADAGRFFNYALKVGNPVLPPEMLDDLSDRTRLFFAEHLRYETTASKHAPRGASDLFGRDGTWSGPVVGDAVYATKRAGRRAATSRLAAPVKLVDGTVTAITVTRGTFDVVVASSRDVVCWRVDAGRVAPVGTSGRGEIIGLSTDSSGTVVYLLLSDEDSLILRCSTATDAGAFEPKGSVISVYDHEYHANCYLQPSVTTSPQGGYDVTLATPSWRKRFVGPNLVYLGDAGAFTEATDTNCHLLAITGGGIAWVWGGSMVYCRTGADVREIIGVWAPSWTPSVPEDSPLASGGLDWLTPDPQILEVVGTNAEGNLYWSEFDGRNPNDWRMRTATAAGPDHFLAACLLAPGLVAAASRQNEIHWLRPSATALKPFASPTSLGIPARAVALVARPHTNEVVAVLEDGTAVRVPRP